MIKKKELKRFRSHIRGLEREISIQLKEDTGCCGVSLAQCHALMEMAEYGEMTATGLADRLELDKSTLSRTVEGMTSDGLIERVADKSDRRKTKLRVTSSGQTAIDCINRVCDKYYSALFELIPPEKHETVIEAVELLAGAMKKVRKSSDGEKCVCCGGQSDEEKGL